MQSQHAQIPNAGRLEPGTEGLAESRLSALAAAVREHERAVSDRPYAVRHADLRLYRRLRQISGTAA